MNCGGRVLAYVHPKLRAAAVSIAPNAGLVLVDLVVHVRSGTPFEEAHRIAHEVERVIRWRVPQVAEVLVHAEPAHDLGDLEAAHAP